MTEEEWLACDDAREMGGPSGERKERLFSVACCRCNQRLLEVTIHREALDIAERFADGEATEQEMQAIYDRINSQLTPLDSCETEIEIQLWAEAVAVLCTTCRPPMSGNSGGTLWHLQRAAGDRIDPQMASFLRDIVYLCRERPLNPPWLMSEEGSKVRDWPQFANWRFKPEWLTTDVLALARGIYAERAFDRMPILADALQDAGCTNENILNHCRDEKLPHVRGCWVVDLVLGKE